MNYCAPEMYERIEEWSDENRERIILLQQRENINIFIESVIRYDEFIGCRSIRPSEFGDEEREKFKGWSNHLSELINNKNRPKGQK